MRRVAPVLSGLLGLVAWSLLAARVSPVLLPSPLDVAAAWGAQGPALLRAAAVTAGSAGAGLLVGSGLAIALAVGFVRARWLELALAPWALLIQALPVVAIAPLLVVWLDYGPQVAVVAATIVTFFPMLSAAHTGLRGADPAALELVRLYGGGFGAELRHVRLPGAAPAILGGLRGAGGLAVVGAIVGEFVGANGLPPSLGFLVLQSMRRADTPVMFAAVTAAGALALGVYLLVRALEARLVGRWWPGARP
jgi:ABC-type nitrate/sulfonate/bicarbonate transport system permease component